MNPSIILSIFTSPQLARGQPRTLRQVPTTAMRPLDNNLYYEEIMISSHMRDTSHSYVRYSYCSCNTCANATNKATPIHTCSILSAKHDIGISNAAVTLTQPRSGSFKEITELNRYSKLTM